MRDRGLSKIGKAKQCLVRRFAYLSDSLQASREQRVLYPRWESNFTGWRLIRKLWRWLKLAHFFAFSPISNRAGLSRLNITASALSIAGAVAGASVARFIRCERGYQQECPAHDEKPNDCTSSQQDVEFHHPSPHPKDTRLVLETDVNLTDEGLRSRAHCLVYVAPATQRQNATNVIVL